MSDPVWAAVAGVLFCATLGLCVWCKCWDRNARALLDEMWELHAANDALLREIERAGAEVTDKEDERC